MTPTDTTKPRLIGIEMTGGACERCDKELAKVRFVVRDGDRLMVLGKKCAAKVTGWKSNEVERQARQAVRAVVLAERRERLTAEFPTLSDAQIGDVIASDWAWRGEEWREFARRHAGR